MKKNKTDAAALIMLSPKERRKREKQRRHDICQDAITSGHYAHVLYISPLPRGDGKIHSVKGKIVRQDNLYFFIKRPRSGEVRILKSQMFLMTTQGKQRASKRKS